MVRRASVLKRYWNDRRLFFAVLLLVSIIGTAVLGLAAAGSPRARGGPPDRAIKAASGKLGAHTSWSIWLFGSEKLGSCWITRVVERKLPSESTSCGFSVPGRPWQLAAKGSAGSRHNRTSMLFFLTRRTVDRLRVRLATGGGFRWIEFNAARPSRLDAMRANLPTNFGYAGHSFRGSLGCISRILVFNAQGSIVDDVRRSAC